MKSTQSAGSVALGFFALALIVLQSARLRLAHEEMAEEAAQRLGVSRTLNTTLLEREALLEGVSRLLERADEENVTNGGGLSIGLGSGEHVNMRDGVVYGIATACGNCPRNFGWLKALEKSQSGTVIGVSATDAAETLDEYSHVHGLPFPLHQLGSGAFLDALPRHATPVTLVVRDSRLSAIYTGVLGDSAVAEIHRSVSRPPR